MRIIAIAFMLAILPNLAFGLCRESDDILERLDCLRTAERAATAELDRVWPLVIVSYKNEDTPELSAAALSKISAAQQTWNVWRDTECIADAEVGRIPKYWEVARLECVVRLTRERSRWLAERHLP